MSEPSEEGPQVPILDTNSTRSKHTNRDAQCTCMCMHTHTQSQCSHSLSPALAHAWGQSLSWGQVENQTLLWVATSLCEISERVG